jgi:sodium-dependent dicarboxylate transporter 2/3/5
MLMAAFAASVAGLGTPVGTPPNLIGIGLIQRHLGVEIPFFHWMAIGTPLAIFLIGFLVFYFNRVCPAPSGFGPLLARHLQQETRHIGPMQPGERNAILAFTITVIFWILPGVVAVVSGTEAPLYKWLNQHIPEAVAAIFGATLLFILPVDLRAGKFTMSWKDAARIDWGTILLFGGGLTLGDLMFSTGLAEWMGQGLAKSLEAQTTLGLTVLFAVAAVVVSETASNTASASMVVPVAIAVAQAAGVNPMQPALAACLAASMGFMLPVSTAPNAIVYGSGYIPLMKMVRYGVMLDIVGTIAVIVVVIWMVPWLF